MFKRSLSHVFPSILKVKPVDPSEGEDFPMKALKPILTVFILAGATFGAAPSAHADVPPPDGVTYSWKSAAISGSGGCTASVGKAVASGQVYMAARVNCSAGATYYSVVMYPQRGRTTLGTPFKTCGTGYGCILRRSYTNPAGSQTWYLSMKGCARNESTCSTTGPRWVFTA